MSKPRAAGLVCEAASAVHVHETAVNGQRRQLMMTGPALLMVSNQRGY